MAAQAPIRLAPSKFLNDMLDRRVIDHFGLDACPRHRRLANPCIFPGLVQKDPLELDPASRLDVAKIDPDHIAFTDAILPRTIFKYSVHGKLPLLRDSIADR